MKEDILSTQTFRTMTLKLLPLCQIEVILVNICILGRNGCVFPVETNSIPGKVMISKANFPSNETLFTWKTGGTLSFELTHLYS